MILLIGATGQALLSGLPVSRHARSIPILPTIVHCFSKQAECLSQSFFQRNARKDL